jgi:hypothetical protein
VTNGASVVRITDLRRASLRLLQAAEERFGDSIDLTGTDIDYYWNIDLRASFDMASTPERAIDVGQLSDDAAEVRLLLDRANDQAAVLWHDLQHLLGMLRLLAYLDIAATNRRPEII